MNEQQIAAYKSSVYSLLVATKQGIIKWRRQNPTTYYYESRPKGEIYVTSIQKLPNEGGYTLYIIDRASKDVILDLSTFQINRYPTGAELSITIKILFDAIESAVSQNSVEVFNAIINDIKNRPLN